MCRSGAKICLVQASVESVPIFSLLRLLFSPGYEAFKAAVLGSGVSEVSLDTWAAWACTFIDNLANYKSFGDTKFVPGVETHVFEAIIKASPAYAAQAAQIDKLWGEVKGIVYDLRPRLLQMGACLAVACWRDHHFRTNGRHTALISNRELILTVLCPPPLHTPSIRP